MVKKVVQKKRSPSVKRSNKGKIQKSRKSKRSVTKSRRTSNKTSKPSANLLCLPGVGPAMVSKLFCRGIKSTRGLKGKASRSTRTQFASWLSCEVKANTTQVRKLCKFHNQYFIKASAKKGANDATKSGEAVKSDAPSSCATTATTATPATPATPASTETPAKPAVVDAAVKST